MPEISRCPFCGYPPDDPLKLSNNLWEIHCDDYYCKAKPTVYAKTRGEAIEFWNARFPAKGQHDDGFVSYAIPEIRSWAPGCELDEDDIAFLNQVAEILEERCQK